MKISSSVMSAGRSSSSPHPRSTMRRETSRRGSRLRPAAPPPLDTNDPTLLHDLANAAPPLPSFQPLDLGDELQVSGHFHVSVERHSLRQIADSPADLKGMGENVVARHARPPAARGEEACEDPHRGGLPGAVRPEKTHDLSLLDSE